MLSQKKEKSSHEIIMIGRCAVKGCNHIIRKSLYEIQNAPEQWNDFRCTTHPKYPIQYKELKGTFNPEHKCDDRCTHAKGHTCDCSCGGANHGIAWAGAL